MAKKKVVKKKTAKKRSTKSKKSVSSELEALKTLVAALTVKLEEAGGNVDEVVAAEEPKKRGRPKGTSSKPITAAAEHTYISRPLGEKKITGRKESMEGRKFTNKFVDDGRLVAGESIKKNPKMGVPEVTPRRQGEGIKYFTVVCETCHRSQDVKASELPPAIGGSRPYFKCDRCCSRR